MPSLVVALLATATSAVQPDVNLASIEAGAVLVDVPQWDGVRVPAAFVEVDPNDGRSQSGGQGPCTLVYELEQRSTVVSIELRDTRPDAERATTVEISPSSSGPAQGSLGRPC